MLAFLRSTCLIHCFYSMLLFGDAQEILLSGCKENDVSKVESALSQGALIDGRNHRGNSCLHLAAKRGYLEITTYVFKQPEADLIINFRNNRGQTPLHRALLNKKLNIAKLLLANGASATVEDERGKTPLQISIDLQLKDRDLMLMLRNAYKPSITEKKQKKAAYEAAFSSDNNLAVNLFLQQGEKNLRELLDTPRLPVNPQMAQQLAAKSIELNEKAINESVSKADDRTPDQLLLDACMREDCQRDKGEIEKDIYASIDRGAKIDLRNFDGKTPIYLAASRGNLTAVKALASRGADVNRGQGELPNDISISWKIPRYKEPNNTPLHIAIIKGHIAVVSFLVEFDKVDIELANQNGMTPFHTAVRYQKHDIAKLLIRRGCDIFAAAADSAMTPLHTASELRDQKMVELILNAKSFKKLTAEEKNTIINQRDQKGETPLFKTGKQGIEPSIPPLALEKCEKNVDRYHQNRESRSKTAREGRPRKNNMLSRKTYKSENNIYDYDSKKTDPISKLLIEAGANPLFLNKDGTSGLQRMTAQDWRDYRNLKTRDRSNTLD